MSAIEKITISLPAEMLEDIRRAVEAGEFTNTSEAIRAALRQWRQSRTVIALNDDMLRKLVREGHESGDPVDGPAALQELRARYLAMAGQ